MVSLEDYNKLKKEFEDFKILVLNQQQQQQQSQQAQSTQEDDTKSVTFTDYDSTTDKETSESEAETSAKGKQKRKKKKKDLKSVLKSHQKIIKGIANAINTKESISADVATELNNLSKTHVNHAIRKNNSQFLSEAPNVPSPPKLREEGHADIKVLREAIASLKDLFKNAFNGDEREDVMSLLKHASQLAHTCNLSIEQFYTLLKSRINMGSNLYTEVSHHYNEKSPPRVLFKELIPAYSSNKNFLTYLNKMTNYKPAPGESPNTIFTNVKTIAIQMADSSNSREKGDYILERVREKILTLFPNLAPRIIEQENKSKPKHLGEFAQLFLSLAPLVQQETKKGMSRNTVYEVMEDTPAIHEISSALPIKLTRAQAQQLDNRCYKCGNGNPDQGPHFGRDCILYRDTPLAAYMCRRCDKGVHLPKHCKQIIDSIHQIEIIDTASETEEIKN